MRRVTILDLGTGNIAAVRKMCQVLGWEPEITQKFSGVMRAEMLIIPGVGAFDAAARTLHSTGLADAIHQRTEDGNIAILGLCLGMHLLLDGSDEGVLPGLGLIPGRAVKIGEAPGIKVPHMGWNRVRIERITSTTETLGADSKFYFAHSFTPRVLNEDDVILTTEHGKRLVAGIERGLVTGVQFHPEKSHDYGRGLLQAFLSK